MNRTSRGPLVALGVVLVLAVVAVVWGLAGSSSRGGRAGQVAEVSASDGDAQAPGPLDGLARRQAGDPLAMGDVNAPVVMIMWSDFQCPFCGRFARETEPALVERYVKKGTLRLEWRDFPYLGEQSPLAARAARGGWGTGCLLGLSRRPVRAETAAQQWPADPGATHQHRRRPASRRRAIHVGDAVIPGGRRGVR